MSVGKAIFFAYHIEAAGVIERFGFRRAASEPFEVFKNARGNILALSGIGQLNAANCFWHVAKNFEFEEALNVGAVGSLRDGYELGDILEVSKVVSTDPYYKGEFPLEVSGKFPSAVLATSHTPVMMEFERSKLSRIADIVDMECCGFCAAAALNGKKISALKFVSDFSEICVIPENIIRLRGVLDGLGEFFA